MATARRIASELARRGSSRGGAGAPLRWKTWGRKGGLYAETVLGQYTISPEETPQGDFFWNLTLETPAGRWVDFGSRQEREPLLRIAEDHAKRSLS